MSKRNKKDVLLKLKINNFFFLFKNKKIKKKKKKSTMIEQRNQ